MCTLKGKTIYRSIKNWIGKKIKAHINEKHYFEGH